MLICVTLFLTLALLDFSAMHLNQDLEWLYRYWIALGILVSTIAITVSYIAWLSGLKPRIAIAIAATIILLFVAGLLDIFYALLAYIKGEPYGFNIWSAQYKWFVTTGILPTWDWPQQIIWTTTCLITIILIWHHTLNKQK